MKSSLRCLVVVILLSNGATAALAQTPRDERRKVDAWRKAMTRTPLPKKGCFKVTYPGTTWQEMPCAKPPDRVYGPNPGPVGHGIDFEAQTAGLMSSATGSFDDVNVTSEMNNGMADVYSLQL